MSVDRGATVGNWTTQDAAWLAALIFAAAVLRIVFYAGYFGSDEVTYALEAVKAAQGVESNATYIGSIRFGVNYPMAAAVWLFGVSEASLATWGMICSVLEVAVVFVFARAVGGIRLAVVSGFLLALIPLHVHLAGRLMADPPLAFFITATFVLFYFGERTGRWQFFLVAGISAGFVYWVKEQVAVFVLVLALWPLFVRRFDPRWLWAVAGLGVIVALNWLVMWLKFDNALQVVDSIQRAITRPDRGLKQTSPVFYLKYLFADVRHTSLLGFLAAAGVAVALRRSYKSAVDDLGRKLLLLWGLGLCALFSLLVVQFDPLRLIPKQTNYMSVFFAPLSVLAALWLTSLTRRWLAVAIAVGYAGSALVLSGLEQQAVRAFVANSRPTFEWAQGHPGATVYVGTNAFRYGIWRKVLGSAGNSPPALKLMDDIPRDASGAFAVVDPQTLGWQSSRLKSMDQVPKCWEAVAKIRGKADWTAGALITKVIVKGTNQLPRALSSRIGSVLDPLHAPRPATAYRIPAGCETPFGGD